MLIGRFLHGKDLFYGSIHGTEVKKLASFYPPNKESNEYYSLMDLEILPPCSPSKIIAVGLNYRDHARELGMAPPEEPIIFLKPPSAVIGPDEVIVLPKCSQEVHYEGELAVVIGKTIYKPSSFKEVEKAILGYTCFNDVTARDLQRKDGQWTRSKSFNTFAPIGPWIETELDPTDLLIKTWVNGELRQYSSTKELVFNVFDLVKFISDIMTLYPGDVIATGTPPGVGKLYPGDVVEVEIEGIGVLRNLVREEK